MNIPEEVTEAVARAIIQSLREDEEHDRFGAYVDFHEDEMTGEVDGKVDALLLARAALSAAAPSLMAMALRNAADYIDIGQDTANHHATVAAETWLLDRANELEQP